MLAVLTELAKHQGETLSKEHLILAVWGTIHTSDMVLSRAISDLRKVFGDSAKKQIYIKTMIKQGYRLIQPVSWQQEFDGSQLVSQPEETAKPDISATRNNKGIFNILAFTAVALMVLVFGYWFFAGNATNSVNENDLEPNLTYITANNDNEYNLRFSRDGTYLAYTFSSDEQPGSKIRLRSLIDNTLTTLDTLPNNLTKSKYPTFDVAPTFSPDGNEVAYKHLTKEGCYIHIFNLSNAQTRELSECPFSKTDSLDWSPDGENLIITVFNYIEKIEGLALINLKSGKIKALSAPEHSASGYLWSRFSPNASTIALVYVQPNSNLWTISLLDIKSGKLTPLLELGNEVSQVVWNESGDSLYYLLTNSNDAGIWKINLSTKFNQLIAKNNAISLDFDHVTKQFAYVESEESFSIWQSTLNKDGDVISQPMLKELPQTNYPSLSKNNKQLAFISTTSGIDSLWLRDLSEKNSALIFQGNNKEKLSEPRWSPDGNKVLVSALSKGASRIIQFDLELGSSSQIQSENNVKMGKWSHDGSMMYWYEEIDQQWHVMEKNLANNQIRILMSEAIFRFDILDKHNLHYQKIGTIKVHSRLLANASSTTSKDKLLLPLENYYSWDAHLNTIYYSSTSKEKNVQMLFKMDLSTGLSESLYPIDAMMTASGRNLSVSNDGSTAYYTRLDKYKTDIVLMKQKGKY